MFSPHDIFDRLSELRPYRVGDSPYYLSKYASAVLDS